ncbi:MAG: hypothetical protein NVSMB2_11230 [Chloroflexota bacterium]
MRVDTVAAGMALLLGLAFILSFLVAAVFRLTYPFALQLTEPISLIEIERIVHGQPIYVQPSLAYVPMIYGPVYFYLSAAVAAVIGTGYAPLRMVSLLASVGTLLVIGRLVTLETRSRWAGVVAAGLYAATFPLSDTSQDLGRVDALFTFWLFAALYVARGASFYHTQVARSLAFSGVLLGLAALTKLPLGALPVGLGIAVAATYEHKLRGGIFVAALLVTVAIGVLILRAQSGPWPTWYMWDLPRMHDARPNLIGRFWFVDVLPRLSVCLLLGPLFVVAPLIARDGRPLIFYGMATGSTFALSWISRANGGGAPNVLLPAFAMCAVLLGLGAHAAISEIRGASTRASVFRAYILTLCMLQFALLAYNPRISVPYRSDEWAEQRLSDALLALPPPILAVDLDAYMHSVVASDHPMFGPLGDIQGEYGGPGTPEGAAVAADIRQRIMAQTYHYVVLLEKDCCLEHGLLSRAGYRDAGPLFAPGDVFYEWKTGRIPEPELYVAPDSAQ